MKRRYLVWMVNHTFVLIDTTPIGLPNEIFPPKGKRQSLTSLRFPSWEHAKRFLLDDGAEQEALDETWKELSRLSVTQLIVRS